MMPVAAKESLFVRTVRILTLVAAVLGFSAIIVMFVREGRVDWRALSAGVIALGIVFTVGRKR